MVTNAVVGGAVSLLAGFGLAGHLVRGALQEAAMREGEFASAAPGPDFGPED